MKKKKHKHPRLKIAFWAGVWIVALGLAIAPHTRISAPPSVTVKVEQPSDARPVQGEESPPSQPSIDKGEGAPSSQPSPIMGGGETGAISSQPAPSAAAPISLPPAGGVTVPVAPEAEAPPSGKPAKIAIVVDDLGPDYRLSQKAIRLPAAVTLAFLPYGGRVRDLAKEARDRGHEILLHMPMEPLGSENPGQGALRTDLPLSEIQLRFQTALASFTGFDGVNNHMGSKFTAFAEGMNVVADEMLQRNLFFLDSRTNVNSIASRVAKEKGLPFAYRDVFLDDDKSPEAIRRQLALAKRIAERKGYAVAIGHPHNATLDVLEKWTADAAAEGVELVPVNAVIGSQ